MLEITNSTEGVRALRQEVIDQANSVVRGLFEKARTGNDQHGIDHYTKELAKVEDYVGALPDEIIPLFAPMRKHEGEDYGRWNEIHQVVERLMNGSVKIYESDEGILLTSHKFEEFQLLRNNALARPNSCSYLELGEDQEAVLIKKLQT